MVCMKKRKVDSKEAGRRIAAKGGSDAEAALRRMLGTLHGKVRRTDAYQSTIDSRGRSMLPKAVREHMDLKPRDRIESTLLSLGMKRRLVRKDFRLDPDKVARAQKALGAASEAEAVRMAIEMVITEDARGRKQRADSKEAARRLAAIGGSVPDFPDIPRRRTAQVQNLLVNPPAPNAKLRPAAAAMPKPTKIKGSVSSRDALKAMQARAKTYVISFPNMKTAKSFAASLGADERKWNDRFQKWKTQRKIFSVVEKGAEYFPIYALDPARGYKPKKAVGQVLQIFGGSYSSLAVASWFVAVNSFLNERCPTDLLDSNPALVIEAAKDEMTEISHG